MKLSKKNVISIKKFVSNYLLENYTEDKKLTHYEMYEFLKSNNLKLPKRIYMKNVKKTDILTGKVLFVEDENGKTVAYINPLILNETSLLTELNSTPNIQLANKVRKKYLESQGLFEGKNGEILSIADTQEEEYVMHHHNRNKVLENRRK